MFIKKLAALFMLVFVSSAAPAVEFTAKSWLVVDSSGHVLDAAHQDTPRSIASITKLMTVLVVLDQNPDLNKQIVLKHNLASSKRISKRQKQLSINDLITLSMVSSDNLAAANLCGVVTTKKQRKKNKYPCVSAMNAKAKSLGMHNTKFVEPTGLSTKNISTAEDLAKLITAAAHYDAVVKASQISHSEIKSGKLLIPVKNTNSLVGGPSDIIVSKTGWTLAAGGCIAMFVGSVEEEKRIVVILGSKSVRTRISEASQLIQKTAPTNKDTGVEQETNINTNNNRDL